MRGGGRAPWQRMERERVRIWGGRGVKPHDLDRVVDSQSETTDRRGGGLASDVSVCRFGAKHSTMRSQGGGGSRVGRGFQFAKRSELTGSVAACYRIWW